MYFRFAAALLLVVLVSMAGVRLEKQTLDLRRAVSVQYYQTDLLLEMLVRLRLETQRLTAPSQLGERKVATLRDRELGERRVSTLRGRAQSDDNEPQTITVDHLKNSRRAVEPEKDIEPSTVRLPLLRFRHPFNPEGID